MIVSHKGVNGWVVGIGGKEREYEANRVVYLVDAKFVPSHPGDTLPERMAHAVVSNLIPLTTTDTPNTMTEEYAYSTVGKEET